MQAGHIVSFSEVVTGRTVAPESSGQSPVKGFMQELKNRMWKRGSHWPDHGTLENQSDRGVTPPHWTLSTISFLWRAKAGGKEENRITS